MPNPDLLSTAEVAQLLGCRVNTVNRWVRIGRLTPAVSLAGRTGARLFRRADVDQLRRDRAA
jgi:excisionase family DNA binding protein